MRNRTTAIGALLGTAVGLAWGGQFVVGKSALGTINAFPLTTIRYAVAALLWLGVLAAIEGRRSLRLDGRGLRLFWLGTHRVRRVQPAGLHRARARTARERIADRRALTAPDGARALAAQRQAARHADSRPARCRARRGRARHLERQPGRRSSTARSAGATCSSSAGCFSFVLYGLGAQGFRDFSPLRYTALTAGLGWLVLAAATAVAIGAGLVDMPSAEPAHRRSAPQIAYLAIPGAFVAVLAWNGAIKLLGAQNASLFGNLIPVTTFAIEIVRGYRPGAAALAGAVVTVAALVANNLVGRSTTVWRWPLTQAPNGSRGSGGTSGAVSALPWSFSRSSSSSRE